MKKLHKKIIFIFILSSLVLKANAVTMDELTTPKNSAYRVGTGDTIEKPYKEVDLTEEQVATYDKEYIKNMTYADSTLKDISTEISKLLETEKPYMLEDVQILWSGAATKSETIKFALYKLSNPEKDKPDENIVKKIIRPLASFSTIAGAGFMNPLAATTAMMSGQLLNSMSFNDKDLNYKFSKVNDADMIILIRKVDELQKRMLREYFDYMTSYNLLRMSYENLNKRYVNFQMLKSDKNENLLIADSYYRVALDNKAQVELDFLAKRAALEQLVGTEALNQFETKLKGRNKEQ